MSPLREHADSHRQHLMWSLQALAAPADVQARLYPDFVVKADELALDFDDWYACAQGSTADEWTSAQGEALAAIDAKLSGMSRGGREFSEDLWLEPALRTDSHWEAVRRMARAALRSFGWPIESPPQDPGSRGTTYVPSRCPPSRR